MSLSLEKCTYDFTDKEKEYTEFYCQSLISAVYENILTTNVNSFEIEIKYFDANRIQYTPKYAINDLDFIKSKIGTWTENLLSMMSVLNYRIE